MSRSETHRSGALKGALAGAAAAALLGVAAPAVGAPAGLTVRAPGLLVALEVAPAAPVLTSAPSNPTNVASPTFAWTGTGASWSWTIASATGEVLEKNTVTEPTVTVSPLPADGAYTFSVWPTLATSAVVDRALVATHAFTLDTVAPPPPRIVARPSFPTTVTTPAFTVADLEAGATPTWNVAVAGGTLLQEPLRLEAPTVTLPALTPGSYVFQVRQTDPAGNVSLTAAEPFAIVAPPAPPAVVATPKKPKLVLPKMNTKRLKPAAGASIRTVRPVLTWSRGPKGTTLYNVQVFRVGANASAENADTVKLTKLRSVFPRSRQVRLRGLKRGQCYVWRVWPYIGSRFTSKPLGVSNFCVKAAPKRRART